MIDASVMLEWETIEFGVKKMICSKFSIMEALISGKTDIKSCALLLSTIS